MDFGAILKSIWEDVLNSPAVVVLLASLLLLAINKWFKPAWDKYQAAIIQAVKLAEKAIPDDTANAGLARFDWALKYAVKVIAASEETTPSQLPTKTVAAVKDGITILHDRMEAEETL